MLEISMMEQIAVLAIICLSFYIFAFERKIKEAVPPWEYASYCFLIPVVLLTFSFILNGKRVSVFFFEVTDTLLVLALTAIIAIKAQSKWYKQIKAIAFILLVAALAAGFFEPAARYFNAVIKISPYVLLSACVILLIGAKRLYDGENTFITAVLFLAAEAAFRIYKGYDMLSMALGLCAYSAFTAFFTRKSIEPMKDRLSNAEKKLSELDHSLEPEIRKRTIEIERINESIVEASKIDKLSRALNRAAIIEEIERLIRVKVPEFSILMFDIDDFKNINDNQGHIVGDKYIHRISLETRSSLRKIDKLGRYGGDEFIAVLPGLSLKQAIDVAQRLRKRIEEIESINTTISIGIAAFPQDGQTLDELIAIADKGLYTSKKKGKNSVSHWPRDREQN
jgi:diguanylate cyclase (GGDEF)-like protein